MRQLTLEQRLNKIDDNIATIKQLLEQLCNKTVEIQPAHDATEILTVKQVVQFLGLDANIIYAKCAKGDIPFFKIGKGYRFKKADILKWVEGQKEGPKISVDDYVDRYMQKHVMKS